MIENCSDLLQCESKLSEQVRTVGLLGQIEPAPQDLEHLETLIRQAISPDIQAGTRFLTEKAPTCLACFLVWTGIVKYREGSYWPAVQESTSLPDDPTWHASWGQAFIDFLQANNLPRFDVAGSLAYVTPILAHGGIPNSCLAEFFEKIVWPMVEGALDDPTDRGEVIRELIFRRENDKKRASLKQQYDDLRERTRPLRQETQLMRRAIEAYDKVIRLWKLEVSASRLESLAGLFDDYTAFREHHISNLDKWEGEIGDLEKKQAQCAQSVERFTEQDMRVLTHAEAIACCVSDYPAVKKHQQAANALKGEEDLLVEQLEQSRFIFSEPWDDEYGELLIQLPFDTFQAEIRRFEAISFRRDKVQQKLDGSRNLSLARRILLFFSAFIGWYLHRRTVRRLEQALEQVTGECQKARATVDNMLDGLPLAEQWWRIPSQELYQALISLADVYRKLLETRGSRRQFEEKIYQQQQRLEQLAVDAGISLTPGLDIAIGAMEQALEGARERQTATVRAQGELDNIRPRILELNTRRQAIQRELNQAEKQLKSLSKCDIRVDMELVTALRQSRTVATELRTELKGRYPNLAAIERKIRDAQSQGKYKNVLEVDAKQLAEQLQQSQEQTNEMRQRLTYYPEAFPGIDEPIRRYLLYGGQPAEDFLASSVALAHQASQGNIQTSTEVGLPRRILEGFDYWWTGRKKQPMPPEDAEVDITTGQRFRAPVIFLDYGLAEIVVHFHSQRYQATSGGAGACLEVTAGELISQRQTLSLRIYKSTETLLETQELEFPLPLPADHYGFSLKNDSRVIHRWEKDVATYKVKCLAFDRRSGKLVEDPVLPRGELWLIVHKDFSIEPGNCVLVNGGTLYGHWKDYVLLQLDLDQIDELQIMDSQGQRSSIAVSSARPPALDFVGGQQLEGICSEDIGVYVEPPRICIPIKDEAELWSWRLSISPSNGSNPQDCKDYRLSELQTALDAHIGEGLVEVLLANELLLGQCPVGQFNIRVRQEPYTDWRSVLCHVPGLQVKFDKRMYLPWEAERTPRVYVEILVPEHAEFIPQLPAELMGAQNNVYRIGIDGDEDTLSGTLYFRVPSRDELTVPLVISIPKVKWRVQGLVGYDGVAWRDTIEEMWLGDWEKTSELFLLVELPSSAKGRLKLALDNNSKEDEKWLYRGKARFDLLAFKDALLAGDSIQTFTLTLCESQSPVEAVTIFNIRTRWEAEDIECVQSSRGRTILLKVTWSEKGRTDDQDRIIRLWKMSGVSPKLIIEQKVLQGELGVTLQVDASDLPKGEYLLHLVLEDPWQPLVQASCPDRNAPNTQLIQVVSVVDIRQGQILSICSIVDQGQLYQLDEGMYKITITGKRIRKVFTGHHSVLRTNWFVGNLQVAEEAELETEAGRTNPIRFEYDALKYQITTIEDSCGDGAMYCPICIRLFWSRETYLKEEQNGHPLFGPIEVFNIN